MLDNEKREQIALKRFSLISPVLNGQVDNQKEYFAEVTSKAIDMPYYGMRIYSPKTLTSWLSDYRRGGIDALKPGYRSDRGKSRKIDDEMLEKIRKKRMQKPRINSRMLYESLVKDGVILPEKVSLSTFYRFLVANPDLTTVKNTDEEGKEMKRFAHKHINELWQSDLLHGVYLKVGKSKKQTYLIAFIDDASRYVTYSKWSFSQDFSALRVVLKEAVARKGIPSMIYTDNGKIFRSTQMQMVCAGMGCSLLHAPPFCGNAKGKIERFFRTVRTRFLSQLDPAEIKDIDELNLRYWQWLEEDYHHKVHSALKMSPLDFFMSQSERIKIFPNPAMLDEYFLLRVTRKVKHDATLSLKTILYETDQHLANSRVEVRYDPEWLSDPNKPILLYHEGEKVGEARQVNFHDNAHVKRKGPGRPVNGKPKDPIDVSQETRIAVDESCNHISFASISKASNTSLLPDEDVVGEKGGR
ncbi:MAG: DDE-type integrase/transposase/recombinase [Syntrophothermaceae bacterium]|jgi:putative transposase